MSTRSPHYGLYQWEGTDPVSREEMNHNFSVLEENLHQNLVYKPLSTFVTSQQAAMVSIDLSNVPWKDYHEVVVEFWYDSLSQSPATVYINQDRSMPDENYGSHMVPPTNPTVMTTYCNGLGDILGFRGRVTFFSDCHETGCVSVECRSQIGGRSYHGWNSNITLAQVNTLDLYCVNYVPAGVQVTVWGVK